MNGLHTRCGRPDAVAGTTLALLTLALLGGCSVSGGVRGSVNGGPEGGAHFGINVDVGVHDPAGDPATRQRYEGQTVYVVPERRVSP